MISSLEMLLAETGRVAEGSAYLPPSGRSPKLAALAAFAGPLDRLMHDAHRGSPLNRLPIQKRRNTDHDFPRPLQQRHRKTHLRGQSEQRGEHSVARLLQAQGGRHKGGDGA